jgi:hypothetical protein
LQQVGHFGQHLSAVQQLGVEQQSLQHAGHLLQQADPLQQALAPLPPCDEVQPKPRPVRANIAITNMDFIASPCMLRWMRSHRAAKEIGNGNKHPRHGRESSGENNCRGD